MAVTDDTGSEVLDRIRGLAAQKRITQAKLANELGITRESFSRRLAGTGFDQRELATIAAALGVSVGALYGEVIA